MVHNPFVKLPFKIVSKFYPDFSLLAEIFKFFATCSIHSDAEVREREYNSEGNPGEFMRVSLKAARARRGRRAAAIHDRNNRDLFREGPLNPVKRRA